MLQIQLSCCKYNYFAANTTNAANITTLLLILQIQLACCKYNCFATNIINTINTIALL